MIRIYLLVFIIGLVGSVGYGAVWYYNDTQARIQTLTENNAVLEQAVKTNENTIARQQRAAEVQAELNSELAKQLQEAEKYQDDLRSKLQKHDLTRLSEAKPGLIEKRINSAITKLFDDLESDTAQ
jgi:uncharacterized membrane protein